MRFELLVVGVAGKIISVGVVGENEWLLISYNFLFEFGLYLFSRTINILLHYFVTHQVKSEEKERNKKFEP